MQVSQLHLDEVVRLDVECLDEIREQLGLNGGETAISMAMEDLAVLLYHATKLWCANDLDGLEPAVRQVAGVARRIGMPGLARVAADVLSLCNGGDAVALAATVARMRRVGERSLLAIWDRDDLMI